MNDYSLEIGGCHLNLYDVTKYWIDCESADEKRRRNNYEENNYLAGLFFLLIAGLVGTWLARIKGNSPQKKYLHIETNRNVAYCFSEDEININDIFIELNKAPPAAD